LKFLANKWKLEANEVETSRPLTCACVVPDGLLLLRWLTWHLGRGVHVAQLCRTCELPPRSHSCYAWYSYYKIASSGNFAKIYTARM